MAALFYNLKKKKEAKNKKRNFSQNEDKREFNGKLMCGCITNKKTFGKYETNEQPK